MFDLVSLFSWNQTANFVASGRITCQGSSEKLVVREYLLLFFVHSKVRYTSLAFIRVFRSSIT